MILSGTTTTLDLNAPDTISGTGSGTVSVEAPDGLVTLRGGTVSTYQGVTNIVTGTFAIDGTVDNNGVLDNSAGSVFVQNTATLSGGGIVDASVNVQDSGTLSPGGGDTAILTTGAINFDDASGNPVFEVQVNGVTNPGDDYDQLRVTGSVNIDPGTVLSVSGTVFGTQFGDEITLIKNDGADAVTGHFQGLMDAASVTINGEEFQIDYSGGDGNDVVLVPVVSTSQVYVNDDFFGLAPDTVITDADPNTDGDQTAVFGVTAFATIQAAIDQIEDNGIVFITDDLETDGPGFYAENVILSRNVSLIGTEGDATAVVVDGNASGSVFVVQQDTTVLLDSLTIQNGSTATDGGGIANAGNLTLRNSILQTNTATNGGGVFNSGTATIDGETLITANSASENGGGLSHVSEALVLDGVTIGGDPAGEGNHAGLNGGGLYLGPKSGSITVSNTQIDGNTASGNVADVGGGGIAIMDGVTLTLDATVMIRQNITDQPNGGGGIILVGHDSVLTLDGTLVSGNTSGRGAGVYIRNGEAIIQGTSQISGNAGIFGGGVYFLHADVIVQGDAEIGDNTAGLGAGVFDSTGELTIKENARVVRNVSTGDGGGIVASSFGTTVTIDGGTVSQNTAMQNGGGIDNRLGLVILQNDAVITVSALSPSTSRRIQRRPFKSCEPATSESEPSAINGQLLRPRSSSGHRSLPVRKLIHLFLNCLRTWKRQSSITSSPIRHSWTWIWSQAFRLSRADSASVTGFR